MYVPPSLPSLTPSPPSSHLSSPCLYIYILRFESLTSNKQRRSRLSYGLVGWRVRGLCFECDLGTSALIFVSCFFGFVYGRGWTLGWGVGRGTELFDDVWMRGMGVLRRDRVVDCLGVGGWIAWGFGGWRLWRATDHAYRYQTCMPGFFRQRIWYGSLLCRHRALFLQLGFFRIACRFYAAPSVQHCKTPIQMHGQNVSTS